MKASELCVVLNKCTDILKMFGDIPLTDALDEIYHIAQSSVSEMNRQQELKNVTTAVDMSSIINDNLIESMSKLDSNDLSEFLQNSDIFKSKSALMYLAEKLSITNSKRHNAETLKHFIITYFERGRMDDIIKGKGDNKA